MLFRSLAQSHLHSYYFTATASDQNLKHLCTQPLVGEVETVLQCDLVEIAQSDLKGDCSNRTAHNLAYTVNKRTKCEHCMYLWRCVLDLSNRRYNNIQLRGPLFTVTMFL